LPWINTLAYFKGESMADKKVYYTGTWLIEWTLKVCEGLPEPIVANVLKTVFSSLIFLTDKLERSSLKNLYSLV
jgi:hypothetical protein